MDWRFWTWGRAARQQRKLQLAAEGLTPAEVNFAEKALIQSALSNDLLSPEAMNAFATLELAKAAGMTPQILEKARAATGAGKLKDLDPYDGLQSGDEATLGDLHIGAGGGLDYATFTRMAHTPTIAAIISTRLNQWGEFLQPALGNDSLGFKVQLKDREKNPTRAERRRANELTDWLLNCGATATAEGVCLEDFGRQFMRDSMIWDQACFEKLYTRGGKLAAIRPAASSTIRRAIPTRAEYRKMQRNPNAQRAYVQILREQIVAQWSARRMAFCVRRKRADIWVRNYGYPELEDLLGMLTSVLHGETYNANNFTHGLHAAGVLVVKSQMNRELFRMFKRNFYAMQAGVANARRTPILQLDPTQNEAVESVNLTATNREMEFQDWMRYLRTMICAVFQMSPTELGFLQGIDGQRSSVFQQGPEQQILASKEKGLRPLVRFGFRALNHHVMQPLDPLYEVVPVGLDADQRKAQLDRDLERLGAFMTPNEIRAKYDLPAIPEDVDGGAADLIGSAHYQTTAIQMLQARALEQQDAALNSSLRATASADPFDDPALDPESTAPIDVDSLFPDEE